MLGYNQTVTVFHRTENGDSNTWTPEVIKGVYWEDIRAINASSVSEAAAPQVLMDFPACIWPKYLIEGDYILPSACDIQTFVGSAPKVLLPLGGKKIEKISRYIFGTSLDHIEVILR